MGLGFKKIFTTIATLIIRTIAAQGSRTWYKYLTKTVSVGHLFGKRKHIWVSCMVELYLFILLKKSGLRNQICMLVKITMYVNTKHYYSLSINMIWTYFKGIEIDFNQTSRKNNSESFSTIYIIMIETYEEKCVRLNLISWLMSMLRHKAMQIAMKIISCLSIEEIFFHVFLLWSCIFNHPRACFSFITNLKGWFMYAISNLNKCPNFIG